jgi:hypothetical protein
VERGEALPRACGERLARYGDGEGVGEGVQENVRAQRKPAGQISSSL